MIYAGVVNTYVYNKKMSWGCMWMMLFDNGGHKINKLISLFIYRKIIE